MINNLLIPNIRLFIFGTLRKGSKFDYYMEGSSPLGLYYTRGQLMESTIGSAYINFNDKESRTIGELYNVNYYCLQRIHHLENTSGEFPKGYDLDLIPVWIYEEGKECNFNEAEKVLSLFYKRRNEAIKVPSGDWKKRKDTLSEIHDYLSTEVVKPLYHNDVISHIMEYLRDISIAL